MMSQTLGISLIQQTVSLRRLKSGLITITWDDWTIYNQEASIFSLKLSRKINGQSQIQIACPQHHDTLLSQCQTLSFKWYLEMASNRLIASQCSPIFPAQNQLQRIMNGAFDHLFRLILPTAVARVIYPSQGGYKFVMLSVRAGKHHHNHCTTSSLLRLQGPVHIMSIL